MLFLTTRALVGAHDFIIHAYSKLAYLTKFN